LGFRRSHRSPTRCPRLRHQPPRRHRDPRRCGPDELVSFARRRHSKHAPPPRTSAYRISRSELICRNILTAAHPMRLQDNSCCNHGSRVLLTSSLRLGFSKNWQSRRARGRKTLSNPSKAREGALHAACGRWLKPRSLFGTAGCCSFYANSARSIASPILQ
jgi:hypothetical protein